MAFARALVRAGLPKLVADLLGGGETFATGLTAAGSTQTDALALTADVNLITTAAASTGARLPNYDVGDDILVTNAGASAMNVYPPTGHQINNLSANAALSLPVGKTGRYRRVAATRWIALVGA
jgi:hypothetical protein